MKGIEMIKQGNIFDGMALSPVERERIKRTKELSRRDVIFDKLGIQVIDKPKKKICEDDFVVGHYAKTNKGQIAKICKVFYKTITLEMTSKYTGESYLMYIHKDKITDIEKNKYDLLQVNDMVFVPNKHNKIFAWVYVKGLYQKKKSKNKMIVVEYGNELYVVDTNEIKGIKTRTALNYYESEME